MRAEYKSRKFLGFVSVIILSFVLAWFGKITGGQFITCITTVFGIYCGINIWAKKGKQENDK